MFYPCVTIYQHGIHGDSDMEEDDDDFMLRPTARSAAANYNKNSTNYAGSGALALFLVETWVLIAENVEYAQLTPRMAHTV